MTLWFDSSELSEWAGLPKGWNHRRAKGSLQQLAKQLRRRRASGAGYEAGLVIDRVAYCWWSGLGTPNGKQDSIVLREP